MRSLFPADRAQKLLVVQLEELRETTPGAIQMAAQKRQEPRPAQAILAGRQAAAISFGAIRCLRLSAVSTCSVPIRSSPSRSATVRATRSTRKRPRALSAPAAYA